MAGLSSLSPQGWATDDDFGRTAVTGFLSEIKFEEFEGL